MSAFKGHIWFFFGELFVIIYIAESGITVGFCESLRARPLFFYEWLGWVCMGYSPTGTNGA